MKKKSVVVILVLIAVTVAGYFGFLKYQEGTVIGSPKSLETASAEQGTLLLRATKNQIQTIPTSRTWGRTSFDDLTFELNYPMAVKPTALLVGRNTPNGTRFVALFPERGVHLPLEFADDFRGFDEWGEMNEAYYVQVAEHDFDSDGAPEIVIAVGDGLVDLTVNIIKYHAPISPDDAGRRENWALVGSLTGQQKAIINGNAISLPYGSQGLYTEFTWLKNKFIQTN